MTLSDKRFACVKGMAYSEEDVKEFIKELINNCSFCVCEEDEKFMIKQIKKRAGKELAGNNLK